MRIAITGASGLLGTALSACLREQGHTVLPVTRSRRADDPPETLLWNPRAGEIEADRLEGVDAVVHLAGENVFAVRWTDEKKQRILGSRENGTALLAKTLAGLTRKPAVLVSASAIGIYGNRGGDVLTEASPPSEGGFLSLVCRKWEDATQPAEDAGIRVVHLRTGVVLTPEGGALELMLPAFRLGLGGRVGDADQWFSWIALADAVGGYVHAIHTASLSGAVNLTAPEPVTMKTFAETMGQVLSRPTFLSVPASLVRLVSGEAAEETVLQSARALPEKLIQSGYAFRYPALPEALRHLLGKDDTPAPPPTGN